MLLLYYLLLLHPFPLLCGVNVSCLLHLTRSCASSPDCSLFDKSFLMLSNHLRFGLPLLLSPAPPSPSLSCLRILILPTFLHFLGYVTALLWLRNTFPHLTTRRAAVIKGRCSLHQSWPSLPSSQNWRRSQRWRETRYVSTELISRKFIWHCRHNLF